MGKDDEEERLKRQVSWAAQNTDHECRAPFPREVVGFHSNHGIEPGRAKSTFQVKQNQDRAAVSFRPGDPEDEFVGDQMLFQVYDGHGARGEAVAEFALTAFIDLILLDKKRLSTDPAASLVASLEEVNRLLPLRRKPCVVAGSTAIVALLRRDRLWTANLGDSRCVLGSAALPADGEADGEDAGWAASNLSVEHRPDAAGERERLEAHGLEVKSYDGGPVRAVWESAGGRYALSMSRSLGDYALKGHGVNATAEVMEREITERDRCLILGSDGVWDMLSSEEAVAIAQRCHPNAPAACRRIIRTATRRWKREEGNYRDDASAIVVYLQTPSGPALEAVSSTMCGHSDEALQQARDEQGAPLEEGADLAEGFGEAEGATGVLNDET